MPLLSAWNFSMVQWFNGSMKKRDKCKCASYSCYPFQRYTIYTFFECSRIITTHAETSIRNINIKQFSKHPNYIFSIWFWWFRQESSLWSTVRLWSRKKLQQNHTFHSHLKLSMVAALKIVVVMLEVCFQIRVAT